MIEIRRIPRKLMTARVRMWVTCRTCHGGGYVNRGRDPQWDALCPVCSGDGLVEAKQ